MVPALWLYERPQLLLLIYLLKFDVLTISNVSINSNNGSCVGIWVVSIVLNKWAACEFIQGYPGGLKARVVTVCLSSYVLVSFSVS